MSEEKGRRAMPPGFWTDSIGDIFWNTTRFTDLVYSVPKQDYAIHIPRESLRELHQILSDSQKEESLEDCE